MKGAILPTEEQIVFDSIYQIEARIICLCGVRPIRYVSAKYFLDYSVAHYFIRKIHTILEASLQYMNRSEATLIYRRLSSSLYYLKTNMAKSPYIFPVILINLSTNTLRNILCQTRCFSGYIFAYMIYIYILLL